MILLEWDFNNCMTVKFKKHIALNEDRIVVPLSTPYADPYPIVHLGGTPLTKYGEFIIIMENQLLRYVETELKWEGPWQSKRIDIERKELFLFPNKKLTKILLCVRDLYYDHGMEIEDFMVRKWRMGLSKSDIKPIPSEPPQ